MNNNDSQQKAPDQLNPGQLDQFGSEVTIKKDESISDQGNEWSDMEGKNNSQENLLGEKAEKYIRQSADIEDLPEEEDEEDKDSTLDKQKTTGKMADDDDGENEDDVIEDKDDYVPGYDLGRNKVQ